MRTDGEFLVDGLWLRNEGTIVIKRSCLSSLKKFAGTLIHEIAHAESGYPDVSRDFELKLTLYIGQLAQKAIQQQNIITL